MIRTLPVLLVLVILLSACKNNSKTDPTTAPWNRTANEVIMRVDDEPDRLNPLLSTSGYATQINDQIFQYLLNLDPISLTLIPQLAEARPSIEEINEGPFKGGMKYTFEIQPAAKWDDGTPVTAKDYIFGIKAVMIPTMSTQRIRPYLEIIKDIEEYPGDPKKFSVITIEKSISGEEIVASTIPVMPAHIYDKEGYLTEIPLGDFLDPKRAEKLSKENPNIQAFVDLFNSVDYARSPAFISGSGPYKLTEWKTGQSITLDKKENWWGDKLMSKFQSLSAYPDRLIFKDIVEDAVLSSLVKSEEIDALSDIAPTDFISLQEDEDITQKYNFYTPASLALYFIYLNTKDPKLSDKRVRRAFAHVVNVEEIIKTIMAGFATRTATPVHPDASYYNSDLKPIEFDIAKAKSLLAEVGWKDTNNDGIVDKMINGEKVELIIPVQIVAKSSRQKNMILMLEENAKQAGIGIEAIPIEFNTLKENTRSGNYVAAIAGRSLSPLNWNPKQSWHTGNDNRTGFGNAKTDALIDKILLTLDDKKRNELYKEIQAIIYDEQPEIFLFVPTGRLIIHKRFEAKPTVQHPGYLPNYFKLRNGATSE